MQARRSEQTSGQGSALRQIDRRTVTIDQLFIETLSRRFPRRVSAFSRMNVASGDIVTVWWSRRICAHSAKKARLFRAFSRGFPESRFERAEWRKSHELGFGNRVKFF